MGKRSLLFEVNFAFDIIVVICIIIFCCRLYVQSIIQNVFYVMFYNAFSLLHINTLPTVNGNK